MTAASAQLNQSDEAMHHFNELEKILLLIKKRDAIQNNKLMISAINASLTIKTLPLEAKLK